MVKHNTPLTKDANEYYAVYEHYSKLLRTWLVAYGIGGPVFFLNNDSLWGKLAHSGCARCIGLLFLSGVVIQVIIAVINKTIMWLCYYGECNSQFRNNWFYKCAYKTSDYFWLDFLADIISMILFSYATYLVFKVAID